VDITLLVTLAGLFMGIVIGNAALLGDSLFASIAVPKSLEARGMDRSAAERLFAAEVGWYGRLPSILPTPMVAISSSPSFTMALAKPFKLEDVVYAAQSQVRDDVVSVNGAIMDQANSGQLTMVMVVNDPPDAPVSFTLTQPDGDAKALIKLAAREAMISIAPYRVALSDLSGVLTGRKDAIVEARRTAMRGLNQQWDPSPERATEIVLLHNLLTVLAMERGDTPTARYHAMWAHATPGAWPSAFALVYMNEAFIALTERNPEEAERKFHQGRILLGSRPPQLLRGRVLVLEALIAWQRGEPSRAEELLREALTLEPTTEVEPHYYMAKLLAARGEEAAANTARAAARTAARFDPHYASLAHTVLGIDVMTGEIDSAAFLPERLQESVTSPATQTPRAAPAPAQ
jgi:hypothetical protein